MSVADPLALFQTYLKSKGYHVTEARTRVAQAVFTSFAHRTALELWAQLGASEGASLPTVYRTLELLEDCGLIRRIDLGDTTAYYEPLLGTRPHEHLICTRCGRIAEFASARLEEELATCSQRHGFSHECHHVQIRGLCPACQGPSQQEDSNGLARRTHKKS